MKLLFVSHSGNSGQSVITVEMPENGNAKYETHLFNDNGHTELHNLAFTIDEAIQNHRYLCEKCRIRMNI